MSVASAMKLEEAVEQAVTALDVERIKHEYWEQNEFVVLKGFLPPAVITDVLVPQAERLKPQLNRNYIPGHKKGGSVSNFTVREQAKEFLALYRSPAFLGFLTRLTNVPLQFCPEVDPHACALYYYTEPGDHIGFHYDTSYYKGARYTISDGARGPVAELPARVSTLQGRSVQTDEGIELGHSAWRHGHFQRGQALAFRDAAGRRRGALRPQSRLQREVLAGGPPAFLCPLSRMILGLSSSIGGRRF